ncbi:hypothetical protein K2P56_02950 [Patescibacteria group bacterium]|nr:hypothetical protein [Patescibacteria group bacterium]
MTITQKISASVLIPIMALATILGAAPAIASADSNSKSRIEAPSVAMSAEGKVLVKQAKVTSVSGATINASITLGSGTLSWVLNTDAGTKFYNRTGSTGVIGDIATGDLITFGGELQGNGFTVKALAVKDMTGVVTNASIGGKVESINTSALSLVLDKSRSDNGNDKKVTVQTSASTAISMNGSVLPFASILAGDKVKATGTLSADGLTLSATTLVITRSNGSEDRNFKGFINSWFKGGKEKSNND